MNIENDYLWDKTGEPDPEIQQLEDVLGTLRYQPHPLHIPTGLQLGRQQSFFRSLPPRLAIAATIALLLLGLGLWFGLERLKRNQQSDYAATVLRPALSPASAPVSTPLIAGQKTEDAGNKSDSVSELLVGNVARNRSVFRGTRVRNQLLAMKKRREAEAAKDQLMLALRLASAKLTFVQKKTQNLRDEIHNQHKIG